MDLQANQPRKPGPSIVYPDQSLERASGGQRIRARFERKKGMGRSTPHRGAPQILRLPGLIEAIRSGGLRLIPIGLRRRQESGGAKPFKQPFHMRHAASKADMLSSRVDARLKIILPCANTLPRIVMIRMINGMLSIIMMRPGRSALLIPILCRSATLERRANHDSGSLHFPASGLAHATVVFLRIALFPNLRPCFRKHHICRSSLQCRPVRT